MFCNVCDSFLAFSQTGTRFVRDTQDLEILLRTPHSVRVVGGLLRKHHDFVSLFFFASCSCRLLSRSRTVICICVFSLPFSSSVHSSNVVFKTAHAAPGVRATHALAGNISTVAIET
eukprot:TRINITY_DN9423_c0_g1_i4.p2 TRINITY_DN9423_c0_g1~~TRINITY_DN9423_c0_g1_i4.p2  ORF type:complete len:117 (+),score=3.42 TRINITY_DN9423_c0_g1_i4:251-601(+)